MNSIYVFLIIFFGVIGLVIYFAIVFALKYVSKNRLFDVEKNAPDVINLMPSLSNGFSKGREFPIKQFSNGRTLVSFYPTDQIIKEFGEQQEEFEIPEFIVEKGMRYVIPRGDLSTRRDQVFYLPTNPNLIPENFRNTELGKTLTEYINKQRTKNTIDFSQEEAMKRIEESSKKYAYGVLPQSQIKQILDLSELKETKLIKEHEMPSKEQYQKT